MYAVKSLFSQTTVYVFEACRPEMRMTSPRTLQYPITMSFRPFGEVKACPWSFHVVFTLVRLQPIYVPRELYSLMPLTKSIALCTDRGTVIVDPQR